MVTDGAVQIHDVLRVQCMASGERDGFVAVLSDARRQVMNNRAGEIIVQEWQT